MGNTEKVVDTCLLSVGSAYSLANIEQTLGIIILALQLGWLLTKLVLKIITIVKNKGNILEAEDEFEDVIEKLEDIATSKNPNKETAEDGEG